MLSFYIYKINDIEVALTIIDYHATARGAIPGGNGVFTELHALRKGQ